MLFRSVLDLSSQGIYYSITLSTVKQIDNKPFVSLAESDFITIMTILSHIDHSSSSFYFKVLTGCERTNKYRICNTMSQQIYFALEGKHSSVFFFLFVS